MEKQFIATERGGIWPSADIYPDGWPPGNVCPIIDPFDWIDDSIL